METKDFLVGTKNKQSEFKKHINLPLNHRTILSAPFGTGKTYFLKEFFTNNKTEYIPIHLFPVNYSVAENKDIFELLKYDILFKLLEHDIDFEEVEIPYDVSFYYFIQNNYESIFLPFLKCIPKIGKNVSEVSNHLSYLLKEFKKQHEDNQRSEQDDISSYLETFSTKTGNIYEEDFYTQLICNLIKHIKLKTDRKIVLIIDDLDRIDPEHIFRIFNILSAHVDIDKESNKFDVDQIILVCHIDNIRKIYANRYGQDVNFSGYIDKFYSKRIFEFDLIKEIFQRLLQFLSSPE